jgi:hypothetical protein
MLGIEAVTLTLLRDPVAHFRLDFGAG